MKRNVSIERLIVQTKPFASVAEEAIVSLFLTVDRVREVAHGPLGAHGLSGEQYNVLRILRGAGSEGLPTYHVVGRMVARAPNITRLTDKLQEKGLLRRIRSREDRRVTRLVVTDEGLRVLAELDEAIDRSTRRAMEGLAPHEIERFLDLLEKVREPLVGSNDDSGRPPADGNPDGFDGDRQEEEE
ncbi:MAG: MarR family transcriptional regulator [Candidatus Eisenbacteria bacterium]